MKNKTLFWLTPKSPMYAYLSPLPPRLTKPQDHNFAPGDGNWPPPHLISGLSDFDARMYRIRYDRISSSTPQNPIPSLLTNKQKPPK